ncbi:hypothetical protein FPRO06_03360 [Fusarium proliferatum]|nr:hypothetical protein FPRO03_09004 [Fusarium proliferatum]KAG4291475.1 hypothetical protein FPRO06_03360 [Fusarium proliferatum]
MDLLDELESMAQAASAFQDDNILQSTIARWQRLFGYSQAMAERKMTEHRSDPLRLTVSEDHWAVVRDRMEVEGHDRPLNSVQAVVQAAGLWCPSSTEVLAATDLPGRPCSFFKINGMDKLAIEGWLKQYLHPGFKPTIIKDPYAQKDLSPTSLYPTLGIDTTLPQFRPGPAATPRPLQNECPVWYFFYGTLTDPSFLSKLSGSNFQAEYHAATIRGGVLKTWGRYYALVDELSHTNFVHGKALLVETREQEERLRAYETNAYEVIRCSIEMGLEEPMSGLTFRFVTDIMD